MGELRIAGPGGAGRGVEDYAFLKTVTKPSLGLGDEGAWHVPVLKLVGQPFSTPDIAQIDPLQKSMDQFEASRQVVGVVRANSVEVGGGGGGVLALEPTQHARADAVKQREVPAGHGTVVEHPRPKANPAERRCVVVKSLPETGPHAGPRAHVTETKVENSSALQMAAPLLLE